MDKREGEVSRFASKIFFSQYQNIIEEPFCAEFQKISGSEKAYGQEGGGSIKIFLRKLFVSQCRKKFVGEPLRVSLIRVSKNLMLKRIMSRFSVEFFLSHSTETFRRGPLLCCVSENFW